MPAQEAGVLKDIKMKEGRPVAVDDLLAQIDDAKPCMEVKVAKAKLAVAKEKAATTSTSAIAKASADVAKADYGSTPRPTARSPAAFPPKSSARN